MFKLETRRLEIAEKVFNWKKATFRDVAKELETTEDELNLLSDNDYVSLLFLYSGSVGEVS